MSKGLLGPYKMFPDIGLVQYYEKKSKNNFLTGKTVFFFESLCFQHLLRCYRNDRKASTVNARLPYGPIQLVP